uniref:Uncharacterized protein n=1 Tax=Anguilla anguilla TaxID=7936 RepID=A0A0E9Q406_ANGAN
MKQLPLLPPRNHLCTDQDVVYDRDG